MRRFSHGLGTALLALLMAIGAAPGQSLGDKMLTLDLKAGEPVGDALARSSLKIKVGVLADVQGLYLPPLQDWNGERYQIRLQGGGIARPGSAGRPSGERCG